MGIQLEKLELIKMIIETNNPIILRKIRDILTKEEKRKSSSSNKIKKDIK
ncbi:hypothetical protein [Flavobacterium sp. CF136]|jgi:hypothetical protein|nr:hypothetical protein [Flavobacterium sp. CF136]EJL66023.1 hypothetical protein PMI10_00772 [Flavobacterium sp. CF136]